jgi:hypothetical protein
MTANPKRARYRLAPVGSSLSGWQIIRDGKGWATHPSALYLGALLDALLRGAEESDAFLIAKTIYERPDPTYTERMAHFTESGPWRPAPKPYKTGKL